MNMPAEKIDKGAWESVIGLEVHVELNTKSKLFSSAPNHFGDKPNTNITEVCCGLPGALPVLNRDAVQKAILFGGAISGEIATFCKFDRKFYFYPDSPKNFQITQHDMPIVTGGIVNAEVGEEVKAFAIDRVLLEEDTGTLKHFSDFTGVDFNRAGIALFEIVSKPCMTTPKEAVAFAKALKTLLQYLEISSCNMEEGAFRFDANVSVRLKGEASLRARVEIKNMNSFSHMEMALNCEIARQIRAYQQEGFNDLGAIKPSTFRWNAGKKELVFMRSKESVSDYCYHHEPDLLPLRLTKNEITKIQSLLPELPLQRKKRYISSLGLSLQGASVLIADKKLAEYFEQASKYCLNYRLLCNWMIVEILGKLNKERLTIENSGISPKILGEFINLIDDGSLPVKVAKEIFGNIIKCRSMDVESIVKNNVLVNYIEDPKQIEEFIDRVLEEYPKAVDDYLEGNDKSFAFLVGKVMKLSSGRAPPTKVNALLQDKLDCLR